MHRRAFELFNVKYFYLIQYFLFPNFEITKLFFCTAFTQKMENFARFRERAYCKAQNNNGITENVIDKNNVLTEKNYI